MLFRPSLAWPEVALASSNTRPRLFGICISTNNFNNFFFINFYTASQTNSVSRKPQRIYYTTNKKNLIGLKPWPEPVALAFQNTRPGQSHHKAVILAWLGLAHGLRPGHAQHYFWIGGHGSVMDYIHTTLSCEPYLRYFVIYSLGNDYSLLPSLLIYLLAFLILLLGSSYNSGYVKTVKLKQIQDSRLSFHNQESRSLAFWH